MPRSRAAAAALALALALGAGACSDDAEPGGSEATTTTAAEGTGSSTTASTAPDETTTTAAPPVAGREELRAALLDPAQVGDGFALDATLGNGAFSGELCEDVTLDATWDEQASQAVTRGEGTDRELVTQAVLSFADAAAAEAFVAAVVEGSETCLPGGEVQEVAAGDQGVLVVVDSGDSASTAGLVRSGTLVAVLSALYPSAAGDPLTTDLLVAVGEQLAS